MLTISSITTLPDGRKCVRLRKKSGLPVEVELDEETLLSRQKLQEFFEREVGQRVVTGGGDKECWIGLINFLTR